MKASPFTYHAPQTQAEAVELLGNYGDAAKPLAGGQSLVPMMALRLTSFDHAIDLNRVAELAHISATGDAARVGAMTRQTEVLGNATLATSVPLLVRAVAHIGHVQIRNRGTIGGSLSHADGAAELPAVAVTLGASIETAGPRGVRTIPAAEFFVGPFTTALADDELLTGIRFPGMPSRSGFVVEECVRRHGDFALVGAMCALHVDGADVIDDLALTFFGVSSTPVRAVAAETALIGMAASDVSIEGVGALAVADLDCNSDIHASGAYRKKVAAVFAGRAISRALEEARS